MDNLRSKYFQLKSKYQLINTFLIVLRCMELLLFIAIVIFVVMYSMYANGQSSWENVYDKLSNLSKVLVPVVISFWVVFEIVVAIIKRKLLALKWKAEIIDEI